MCDDFDFSGKPLVNINCPVCLKFFKGRQGRIYCSTRCASQARKKSADELTASIKSAKLKHRYGLTPEQVRDMAAAQSNRCGICACGISEGRRRHIDHDHKTGKVRELLCASCNTSLGQVERVGIDKFAAYLEKHKAKEK